MQFVFFFWIFHFYVEMLYSFKCKRFLFGCYYFDFYTHTYQTNRKIVPFSVNILKQFLLFASLIWKRCRGYVKPGRTLENRSYE